MVRIWNAMRRMGHPPWREWLADAKDWARTEGSWYAASAAFHALAMMCLLLVPMAVVTAQRNDAPSFRTPPEEPPAIPTWSGPTSLRRSSRAS